MKKMLDDEQRVRMIDDEELEDPAYCTHGISLDEFCAECEEDARNDPSDEVTLTF